MIKCVSYNNNHDATTITTINNNHLNNTHTINNNHTTRAVAVSAGSICFAHPVRDSDSGVSLYLSPSLYLSLSLYIYIYSVRIVYGIQYIAHNIYIYIYYKREYIHICMCYKYDCMYPPCCSALSEAQKCPSGEVPPVFVLIGLLGFRV